MCFKPLQGTQLTPPPRTLQKNRAPESKFSELQAVSTSLEEQQSLLVTLALISSVHRLFLIIANQQLPPVQIFNNHYSFLKIISKMQIISSK